MKIGEFIQMHMDRLSISQAELSRRSGVPASTISSIINRNNDRVAIEMILKICKVLECDINEYIDSLRDEKIVKPENEKYTAEEMRLIKDLRTLDEYGKKAVLDLLFTEAERCANATQSRAFMFRRLSSNKASAGCGYDLNDPDQWESIAVVDTPEARRADFAVEIEGRSMEPTFYDGDIVYISLSKEISTGHIGLFLQNNKGYVKEAGTDCLISHNKNFDNVYPSDGDIECLGEVIGVAELA